MKEFSGKLAVITGAGTGMGRELAIQLASEGARLAICDVLADNMAETKRACEQAAPDGVRITAHECDVSDEAQVIAFRDAVQREHATDHINLLFNNAGIGGGGSFITEDRADWDKTFGVCWFGVYYCSRAFVPLLIASSEGYIINTSSVNGFWASLGPGVAHTAYSAAKFAVKGFTEALLNDLRLNAPHVKAALVMPGHVGTSIVINRSRVLGKPGALDLPDSDIASMRERLEKLGMPIGNLSDDQVRQAMHQRALDFRDKAPLTAAQAATIILDGVRAGEWRILVGDDARALDRLVREDPIAAYEPEFLARLQSRGIFNQVSPAED